MAKKKEATENQMQAVEEALTKTEKFIEKNSNLLTIIVAVAAAIVLGYFAFQKFYLVPKEKEASAQIFMAEKYFAKDSLQLALNGDGQYPGFLEIADDYSITKTGNLAHYYAGVCYLKLGQYEDAIDHLKDFDGNGTIIDTWAIGKLGDAYMELGETEKALDYYLDAAYDSDNDFSTPHFLMKAGLVYEMLDRKQEANQLYKMIRADYTRSKEMRDIERYIARTE
jgi:tetratricopeptide (TPR) repeat protein